MILSKNFVNWFIKKYRKSIVSGCLLVMPILFLGVYNSSAQSANNPTTKSNQEPRFIHGEIIYADVDTANSRLLVVLSDGLWQYKLDSNQWLFLSELESLPNDFSEFEFAYNNKKGVISFWDRGVGRVFEVDPQAYQTTRIDKSHSHRNQFKHQPFIREGNIYAFGGYGYWIWKNYITYYDRELQEWSVQNVDPSSQVPSARVPHTGIYSSSLDEFLIYGGRIPVEKQRADDQYTARHHINDVWRFSFADNSWNKVATIDQRYRFYNPESFIRISRTNGISGSAYSKESDVWYIPTVTEDASDDLMFLTLVHAASGQIGESILLPSIKSNQIVPINFLFNPSSGNLIIVGIKKITDADQYPVEVIRVSEDSLLTEIQFTESNENGYWIYVLILLLLAGLSGGFYLKNRFKQKKDRSKGEKSFTQRQIQQVQWLNSDEKRLLKYLFGNRGYLESMIIDEALWPDIDNYDYRRKLRNDTINSINKKFRKRLSNNVDIIERIKDPDDQRRYLYGLNEDLVDF